MRYAFDARLYVTLHAATPPFTLAAIIYVYCATIDYAAYAICRRRRLIYAVAVVSFTSDAITSMTLEYAPERARQQALR